MHDLKIAVQESRFEGEKDKVDILVGSAQIEGGVGEFEKASSDIEFANLWNEGVPKWKPLRRK